MLLVDQQFLPQATALISMARHSIDICTFKAEFCTKSKGCKLREFFGKLYEKQASGIDVRFLINWHDDRRAVPRTNGAVIKELQEHHITVKRLQHNRCCHAKFIIVDKRRAIVGSHNLSVKSCHYNFEISYLISDDINIARLVSVMDRIFRNSQAL